MMKSGAEEQKKKKGNIIYIGGFILPDKNAAAHRVLNNAKILRILGYDVTFIDTNRELKWGKSILQTVHNVNGFRCYSQPYPKRIKELVESNIFINRVIDVVEEIGSVDAIICYNYQAIPMLRLKKYCSLNNIKLISDCTEGYSLQLAGSPISLIKNIDDLIRMKYVQKKVDGLILISKKLHGYYKKNHTKVLLPPLIDITENKWDYNGKNNVKNNIISFVYAGNVGANKDKLDLIVKSILDYKGSKQIQLTVVGLTKEQFISKYPGNLKSDCVEERIIFKGRLPHSEALQCIKDADFNIFFREDNYTNNVGFPTKLVESFGCGTPVITNTYSDIKNYIINDYNGFIISLDKLEDELFSILKKDVEYLKNLKANVEKKTFHYEHYKDQMYTFFNILMN